VIDRFDDQTWVPTKGYGSRLLLANSD
jgi:hypothetical protein